MPDSLTPPFESLQHELWKNLIDHQEIPDGCLYHYTDATGLIGILSGGTLWASHARYLNDASELQYGSELVSTLLSERQSKATSSLVSQFISGAKQVVNQRGSWTATRSDNVFRQAFVCCFCSDGDLLSQWRGYASRGSGYSIAFDGESILEQAKQAYVQEHRLRRVIYDPKKQRMLTREVIDRIVTALLECPQMLTDAEANRYLVDALYVFSDLMTDYLSCFKHPGFREEHEWRIIRGLLIEESRSRLKFRSASGLIVPYIELQYDHPASLGKKKLPILGVRSGPTAHRDLSMAALRSLLDHNGYSVVKVDVSASELPLRSSQ